MALAFQLLDGCQQGGLVQSHGLAQGGVGQGLGAAQGLGEGRAGEIQLLEAQVLGHAFQGVGGAEGRLPILAVNGTFQTAPAGVRRVLSYEFPHHRFAGQAPQNVRAVAADLCIEFL